MQEGTAPVTVLHVDDEPEFLSLAATQLEEVAGIDFDVRTATTVEAALDILASETVDCVVSDFDMPRTTGIEFLQAVRADDPDVPFILFTGKGSEEIASEAISAGVTDYLQKAAGHERFEILANRIENAVGSARAEAAARRSRARLEQYSSAFPDVAFLIDEEGTYLDVLTGSPETLLAADAEDVVGATIRDLLPPSTAERFQAVVDTAVETGVAQSIEYELEVPAGLRWFEARVAPLPPADEAAVVWVARDITEGRDRRERLDRYRQLLDSMAEAAGLLDADGRFVVVNETLASHHGTDRENLVGDRSRLLDRIRDDRPDEPFRAVVDGERTEVRGELETTWRGGDRAVLAYHLRRLEDDGECAGVVLVCREVTDRREYERLRAATRDRLEQATGVLGHDLRNDLNVAASRLALVADECESTHLPAVVDAHTAMEDRLDDLHRLARGASYALDSEPVALDAVGTAAWSACDTADATLSVAVDAAVFADEAALRRLLEHLFRNAVQHGGPTVAVTLDRRPDGFDVADDGPGLPAERRERVLEAGAGGPGGGFGLRIVDELARAHGWTVRLEPAEAGGLAVAVDDVDFDE